MPNFTTHITALINFYIFQERVQVLEAHVEEARKRMVQLEILKQVSEQYIEIEMQFSHFLKGEQLLLVNIASVSEDAWRSMGVDPH